MMTYVIICCIIILFTLLTNAERPPNDACVNATSIVDIFSNQIYFGNTTDSIPNNEIFSGDPFKKNWYTFTSSRSNTFMYWKSCNMDTTNNHRVYVNLHTNCNNGPINFSGGNPCTISGNIPLSKDQIYYIMIYLFDNDNGINAEGSFNITFHEYIPPTKSPTTAPTQAPIPTTMIPTTTPTKVPTIVPVITPTANPIISPIVSTLNDCGFFGFNIFCPRRGQCGFWKRLFGSNDC